MAQQVRVRVRVRVRARVRARVRVAEWSMRGPSPLLPVRVKANLTEPTARPTTHLPASGHGSSSRAETPTSAATAAANTVPRQRWIPLFVVEPTWLGFE